MKRGHNDESSRLSIVREITVPLLLLIITTEREDYFGMSTAISLLKLKTTAFSFITSDPGDDTTSMTNSAFPFGSVSEPA